MRIMAKPSKPSTRFLGLCAVSWFTLTAPYSFAQAPAPGPSNPLQRLYEDAEKAYGAQDYATVATKLEALIQQVGQADAKNPALERVRFNLGLAYMLLGEKDDKPDSPHWDKAEAAFSAVIQAFPQGEFTSRSALGIGRARMGRAGDDPKKLETAIDPLRRAAADQKLRTEAGIVLGGLYKKLNRNEEALTVFRSLMGSEVISGEQASASIKAIEVLAESGEIQQLGRYLDRLSSQPGIIDLIAVYANELVRIADDMMGRGKQDAALMLYRAVPPRSMIIEQQRAAMTRVKGDLEVVKKFVEEQQKQAAASTGSGLGNRTLDPGVVTKLETLSRAQEEAVKSIEEREDMDAALIMRRGRALYENKLISEARVCFREIRLHHPKSGDLETASFAELATLNDLGEVEELKKLANDFLKNFPDSKRAEVVVGIVGDSLVSTGDWPKVEKFFEDARNKFKNSEQLDGYCYAQAMAVLQQGRFADARVILEDIARNFPNSQRIEDVRYYIAMSWFFENKQKKTEEAAQDYLKRYPKGRYVGEMLYRQSFIQYQDPSADFSDQIVERLTTHLKANPEDISAGSIWCLLGDVYAKQAGKRGLTDEQVSRLQENAIAAYKKAVWTSSPNDVVQYGLETATQLLRDRKDWNGVAELHEEFLSKRPNNELALLSAVQVAKMRQREGKLDEAVKTLGDNLVRMIGDPANEQVEPLIDQIVQLKVPRKKAADIDKDAVEKDVEATLNKIVGSNTSPTTVARTFYAKSRVREALRDKERAMAYMINMANTTEAEALSPVLLARCAEILFAKGDVDRAETFFKRLSAKYSETSYADAGPVGLGYIELKRNNANGALAIFNEVIETNSGTSRYKEAVLGKIQAMVRLNQLDAAELLANQSIGQKEFKGQTAGQIYLELITIKEKRAALVSGEDARKYLLEAYSYAQRTYTAYKAFPEVAIPAFTKGAELADLLGDEKAKEDTLKLLEQYKANLNKGK